MCSMGRTKRESSVLVEEKKGERDQLHHLDVERNLVERAQIN